MDIFPAVSARAQTRFTVVGHADRSRPIPAGRQMGRAAPPGHHDRAVSAPPARGHDVLVLAGWPLVALLFGAWSGWVTELQQPIDVSGG
jgi:hypothetical protein